MLGIAVRLIVIDPLRLAFLVFIYLEMLPMRLTAHDIHFISHMLVTITRRKHAVRGLSQKIVYIV